MVSIVVVFSLPVRMISAMISIISIMISELDTVGDISASVLLLLLAHEPACMVYSGG
jgi:hypothetical protein